MPTSVTAVGRRLLRVGQEHWFLVAGLAIGTVLRVLLFRTVFGRPDSDEAVGILMAIHFARGEFETFFWGQNYGGSLAAVAEAPFVFLFGHAIEVTRLADTAMTLVSALVVRSIGRRLAGRWAGDVAAVGFWLAPPIWLYWSTEEWEFWIPGVLVALLTVWACLRWDEGRMDRRLWPIGFFAGLSFWAYPLLGCTILPAIAAVAWANRHRVVGLLKLLALVPVGAAPWILTNLQTGFASLNSPFTAKETFAQRATHAVTIVLPTLFFSGSGFYQSAATYAWTGWAVIVAAAAFLVIHAKRGSPKLALVGLPILVWPLVFAATKVTPGPGGTRYAYVLLPSLAVMIGWAVGSIRWSVPRTAIAVLLAMLAAVNIVRIFRPATQNFQAVSANAPTLMPLISYLESHGLTHVYANYWTAYVVSLDSNEKITASDPQPNRYAPYAAAARAAPHSVYVYRAGEQSDINLRQWIAIYQDGQRIMVGPFAVYEFDGRVDPDALPLVLDPS